MTHNRLPVRATGPAQSRKPVGLFVGVRRWPRPAPAKPALCNVCSTTLPGSDVAAGYIIANVERLRAPMQKITDYLLKAVVCDKAPAWSISLHSKDEYARWWSPCATSICHP